MQIKCLFVSSLKSDLHSWSFNIGLSLFGTLKFASVLKFSENPLWSVRGVLRGNRLPKSEKGIVSDGLFCLIYQNSSWLLFFLPQLTWVTTGSGKYLVTVKGILNWDKDFILLFKIPTPFSWGSLRQSSVSQPQNHLAGSLVKMHISGPVLRLVEGYKKGPWSGAGREVLLSKSHWVSSAVSSFLSLSGTSTVKDH